jgi:peptidyl-prolyl cis-trans isomerase B (cyclophilin B)
MNLKNIVVSLMLVLLFANFVFLKDNAEDNVTVAIKTSLGDIKVKLFKDKAPKTVENFLQYVNTKSYDNTIFHRVMSNFVIQGGGLTKDMVTKPTKPPVINEATNGLKNKKYSIAMARTNDINSANCQFYINLADNTSLDHKDKTAQGFGYCVFGEVIEGAEVVDKIGNVKTGSKFGQADVPVEPVIIESIRRADKEPAKPSIKLSGNIQGIAFISADVSAADWNNDNSEDGLAFELFAYDKDKRPIKFNGINAKADIRLFTLTSKKTRGKCVYENSGFMIHTNNDLSSNRKEPDTPNRIPFSAISAKPAEDFRNGIFEIVLTTAAQGTFRFGTSLNVSLYPKSEEEPKESLSEYPDYGEGTENRIPGLEKIMVNVANGDWNNDAVYDGIEVKILLNDQNGSLIKYSGVKLTADIQIYKSKEDNSRGESVYKSTFDFTGNEDSALKIPWDKIKLPAKEKHKGIIEVTLNTPKQGKFRAVTTHNQLTPTAE